MVTIPIMYHNPWIPRRGVGPRGPTPCTLRMGVPTPPNGGCPEVCRIYMISIIRIIRIMSSSGSCHHPDHPGGGIPRTPTRSTTITTITYSMWVCTPPLRTVWRYMVEGTTTITTYTM